MTWFYSDPHVDHQKIRTEALVERFVGEHNAFVRPNDRSICLGDFALGEAGLAVSLRLNGQREIILGNHDVHGWQLYSIYFQKLHGFLELAGLAFTHLPIAPWSMRWRANVHGHSHLARPMFYTASNPEVDGRQAPTKYINISVERTNYRPVSLEMVSAWADRF
jgi:calcineurin-like phosphoesterase family protein